MYFHKRKCVIITLLRFFAIVCELNIINIPLIDEWSFQYLFIFLCLLIKCKFIVKNCLFRLSLQLKCSKSYNDEPYRQVHCNKIFAYDLPSDKIAFNCKYILFYIQLSTLIQLVIANSDIFAILPCSYIYVMSQSTFPDQIRLRPFIESLCCVLSITIVVLIEAVEYF